MNLKFDWVPLTDNEAPNARHIRIYNNMVELWDFGSKIRMLNEYEERFVRATARYYGK